MVSDKHDFSIVVNYKSGFSTFNRALIKGIDQPEFEYLNKSNFEIFTKTQKFMFVRDPVSRLKSFYYNYIIEDDFNKVNCRNDTRVMKQYLSQKYVLEIKQACLEEKTSPEFIERFLKLLGPNIVAVNHAAPQANLLFRYGMEISDLEKVYNFKTNLEFLNEKLGCEMKINHQTGAGESDRLDYSFLKEFCDMNYYVDYHLFREFF